MMFMKKIAAAFVLCAVGTIAATAQKVVGKVVDRKTKEPLIGAYVTIAGTDKFAITDTAGVFGITGLSADTCTLNVRFISYKSVSLGGVKPVRRTGASDTLVVELATDDQKLRGASVTGVRKKNTETAMVQQMKSEQAIVSNISAQEIKRTQDSNAGEVVRRVPGVSLIEDKFVMVRGLSQRYNNVWINGGAVPSSEADSRAFSFDIIPSSQMDNLVIVKTPVSEYPADYSGGFIMINTKDIPEENSFEVSLGSNWNDATHFSGFKYNKGSGTDFLGFDGGLRSLDGGIGAKLKSSDGDKTNLLGNGLNNDWRVRNMTPFADLKLSANWNRRFVFDGYKLGVIAAVNYTNEYRTYDNMQNNLFGVYDAHNDRSNYLRYSVDDQYNHNVRLGAMFNVTFLSRNSKNKYQFKNIFNQLGNSRYTWRESVSAQSNYEKSAEYYYRSRTTYNGQLAGKHTFDKDIMNWNLGYAYANRHLPDRRRYLVDDALESGVYALTKGNDVSREWTQLDEHVVSADVNDEHRFSFNSWQPKLKAGAYGEYRTRKYKTREFIYAWNTASNTLPAGFRQMDMTELLSNGEYFGYDRLYLLEQMNMRNDYRGNNLLGAGYLAATLPLGKFDVYAGLRFEHNDMELISNTRDDERSESSRHYRSDDLFPSLNSTYKFNEKHQVRLSYGRTVNRPEFREVSSSVYYDFDLASSVQGNTELRNCYIDNIDMRYEFYPSRGEMVSLAAFYKHFDSPIEWTYTVAGGTDLIYSYKNARSADNYGLELDIRKELSFVGLRGFSWSFNGALIKSRVKFDAGAKEKNRPMQGQSPYLINTGIFYKNEQLKLNASLLYNRIGKRIIGVGRSEGTTGSDENARIPDSYEMPRNTIDLSVSKNFGRHWEVRMNIRDLLAEKVCYKQFADVVYDNGTKREVEQVTRSYKPGRNVAVYATYKF